MTLEEKIGQMTQADRRYLESESDIRRYSLGSILSGGGSSPPDSTAPGWAEMYDRFQREALATRLQIPIIYGIDAVHGHNNVRGAVIFPHNIGLGCTRNPGLVGRGARAAAEEVEATGIDWTFSPCIAVPRDERWGRTYEGFGETPELVAEMAAAAVRGYQPTILACAKHYLADGGTSGGEDQGNARMDEATLRSIHFPGYRSAVAAGVGTVMASYSSWNGQKMHGNRYLLTDVLKGELGFSGFVVSDWAGIDQLPGDYASDIETSTNAGIDMVMVPGRYQEFTSTLRTLVDSGRVSMSRIDEAVRRILQAKVDAGLFEAPYSDPSLLPRVGSDENRQLAREAVRESLVLLKNVGGVLPLSKMAGRIHVSGKNADDLGNQCGGWTITWQGASGAITTGTTILEGLRAGVFSGSEVTYSRDGSGAGGPEAGVVVVGETPYAEGYGDRDDLALDEEDMAAVRAVKGAGVPTVVILVSGRPMILGRVLDDADALVAAWLPGTEGAGVADVLFGDHPPTGKLSHSWPRRMAQIPVNLGDPGYDPLFPYGYGLTY
jgi:beta-glucosidase